MTPGEAAAACLKMARKVEVLSRTDVAQCAAYITDRARKMSSGTKTLVQMRGAGYPYAKSHGAPLWATLPIHSHSGVFLQAWGWSPGDSAKGMSAAAVYNYSRVADYLEFGTKLMFSRPIVPYLNGLAKTYLTKRRDSVRRMIDLL